MCVWGGGRGGGRGCGGGGGIRATTSEITVPSRGEGI